MAYSYVETVASGLSSSISVPMPYLQKKHIKVSVNGVEYLGENLTWSSSSVIDWGSVITAGYAIRVYRETPVLDPIIVLEPANFDHADINLAFLQTLYVVQEAFDRSDSPTLETQAMLNALVATATLKADLATASEASASVDASLAIAARIATEAARDATLASFDSFDDRFLGSKAADPVLDNDGNALVGGSLYFNTVSETIKVYTGSVWSAAYVDGTGVLLRSGGTMTGALTLYADALTALQAVTKQQMDAGLATKSNTGHGHASGDISGLGTAATKNVGTAVGDVVEVVTGGKLPVLDASNLTNIPGVPAGVYFPFAGATLPSGYLWCAGQAVSRATYAALFIAIGVVHGVGDGSTTFNMPDLRGRVPVGKDDMNGSDANRMTTGGSGIDGNTLGAAGGAETHALTIAQMPAHEHQLYTSTGGTFKRPVTLGAATNSTAQADTTTSVGSGTAHNNTQPSIISNYIIKT